MPTLGGGGGGALVLKIQSSDRKVLKTPQHVPFLAPVVYGFPYLQIWLIRDGILFT